MKLDPNTKENIMNYGQALKNSNTVIGRAAVDQAASRKERIAKAQKIANETGRELMDVLTEMWSA